MKKLGNLLVNSSVGISIGMGFVKLIKAIFQILVLVLSAKYFGISAKRDSWIISTTVVMVFIQFFFGPLNETLRAKYIHIRGEKGDAHAIDSAVSLFRFTILVSIILIFACFFFSNQILQFFKNDLTKDDEIATIFMIRIVVPSLVLNQIINFWTSILNTYNSFYLPDILGLISSVINLLVIIFLTPYIGIFSLVASMYLSLILLIIVLGIKLASHNKQFLTFGFFKWKILKPYIFFAFPFYLSYLCGQVAVVIEKKLSTNLGVGKISTLDYSRKFVDLPISIIITISATVLTPIIAKTIVKNDFQKYSNEIIRFIKLGMLVVMPMVLLFVICPLDFSIFFFGRDSFTRQDFRIIASLMSFYSIGIIGVILYTVSGQALVSEKRTKFYSLIAIITQVVPIVINFLFYRKFGLITFGLSWSLSHLFFGFVMFCSLKIQLKEALKQLVKIIVIFAVVGILSFFIYDALLDVKFVIKAPIILIFIVFLEAILFLVFDVKARDASMKFFFNQNN